MQILRKIILSMIWYLTFWNTKSEYIVYQKFPTHFCFFENSEWSTGIITNPVVEFVIKDALELFKAIATLTSFVRYFSLDADHEFYPNMMKFHDFWEGRQP